MISMNTTAKKTARKAVAKPVPTEPLGNLSTKQKPILSIIAGEAWKLQNPGISSDDWRHDEVMDAVRKPGLRCCNQEDFEILMPHFLIAAGREDEAFHWLMKNGKNAEHQRAWLIVKSLADHTFLAHASVDEIAEVTSSRPLKRRLAKREALLDHAEGPVSYDYLLKIVRDITHRPDLILGPDLAAALVERCKLKELFWILVTLNNRIAEREGAGMMADRNKGQRSEAAKARRSPHEMAPRRPGAVHRSF
jgi:hypothetical protein